MKSDAGTKPDPMDPDNSSMEDHAPLQTSGLGGYLELEPLNAPNLRAQKVRRLGTKAFGKKHGVHQMPHKSTCSIRGTKTLNDLDPNISCRAENKVKKTPN